MAVLAGACQKGAEEKGQLPGPIDPMTAPPKTTTCTPSEPFRSPLRRLTRVEYNNTVRDLLGDSSAPADKFPADELSNGFSNNAAVLSVSPLLAEKYQEAAESLAARAVADLRGLVGCDPAGEAACARQFIERFGRRAYRRPLTGPEIERLHRVYLAGGGFARGIELTVRALLQSPSFLYRLETTPPTRATDKVVRLGGYEVATRLSYLLWSTMPDDRLFEAAGKNELVTPVQVGRMARAMLDDPRARPAAAEFYRQWMGLGSLDSMVKDAAVYPELTAEVRAGLRAELGGVVEHHLWTGDRKLETLLTAPVGWLSPALARLYGVAARYRFGCWVRPHPVLSFKGFVAFLCQ
jgi:hypothetical protein